MNPLLLLVGLLLLVWFLVRMVRKTDVPAWLKAVRVLFLLVATLIGLDYGWFRIQRAKADVDRARGTATELVTAMDRYEADKGMATLIVSPLVSRDVVDSVEALVDMANDGDLSKLRQTAQDARYCLAEVGRDLGPLDLLTYTLPTLCRAMFQTLGEPGELADAGVTFGDVAARASAKQRAWREWKVVKAEVMLSRTKGLGPVWDIGGGSRIR